MILRTFTEYRKFGGTFVSKNSDAQCAEPSLTLKKHYKTTKIYNTAKIYMASGMD